MFPDSIFCLHHFNSASCFHFSPLGFDYMYKLTLCMLGNFFKYLFLSKFSKNSLFPPIFLLIYNLNVKQYGSQMKPHILWGFIWIQLVCICHQWSSKFTASRLRVNVLSNQGFMYILCNHNTRL